MQQPEEQDFQKHNIFFPFPLHLFLPETNQNFSSGKQNKTKNKNMNLIEKQKIKT